jgi:addiction module RelB/DinJ family antitoxin/addiction module RelE/StbE family toxin
LWDRI